LADMTPMKQKSLAEKLKILNGIAEQVNKAAKKKVCGFITDPDIAEKLRVKWYPTPSDAVNAATGGGIPRSRMTLVVGKPDSGKTSYFLETIAYNQKIDPDFVAAWLESENSLNKEFAVKTFGIDPDRFFFIEHDREGAGEKALDQVEAVLQSGAINMFVINSLKCLVPSEEFKKAHGEATVGTQARMNAKMMRKFTSIMAENEVAFVVITHLTTQIGSMARDPLIISGGNAIVYGSQLTLDFRKQQVADSDPIKKEEGMKIAVTVKKNHCVPDRNPYQRAEYFVVYGVGVEQYLQVMEAAVEQGILFKSGAYIKDLLDPSNPKGGEKEYNGIKLSFQGKEKFREFCAANPDWFNSLRERVNLVGSMSDEEISDIKAEEEEISKMAKDDDVA
jgi:recombination protein RecA